MQKIEFTPKGVCSTKMIITSNDDEIITDVKIIGGCPGNSLGVSKLCKDRSIDEVIHVLEGIDCRNRGTSCPDQLAKALKELKNKKSKGVRNEKVFK